MKYCLYKYYTREMKLKRMRDLCAGRGINNVKMQSPLFYHLTFN